MAERPWTEATEEDIAAALTILTKGWSVVKLEYCPLVVMDPNFGRAGGPMRLDYSNYYPYARFYQRDHGLLTLRWRTQEVSLTKPVPGQERHDTVIIWPGDFITPAYKKELADSVIYNIWQRMYMVVENHEEFHEHAARRETLIAAGQWV
jgi:hypothetical protein